MVRVSVIGTSPLEKLVKKLIRNTDNTARVFKTIGLRMQKMQVQHFLQERDSQGEPWKPLKPITVAMRRNKEASSIQILRDTGRLYTSISSPSGMKSTDKDAVVGTNVVYATTHQFGSRDGKIPAREFLYLTEAEREVLINMLVNPVISEALRAP